MLLAVGAVVAWGVQQPLAGQSRGIIRGQVRAAADQTAARLVVQARDVETGEILAVSDVDEKTAEYELRSLSEGIYRVELVGREGDVLCSEGPFEISARQVLYESESISCRHIPWWLPLLAAAAGGSTTGVVLGQGVGGSAPAPTTVCHEGRTTTVESDALAGHLSHGDSLGPCPASPSR